MTNSKYRNQTISIMSFLGLRRIRKNVAENYDLVSWFLCILLGGTINIGILNGFDAAVRHSYFPTDSQFVALLFPVSLVALAVIMPIILSLIFSAIQPELRIVSPFFITLMSSVWFFVLWVNTSNVADTLLLAIFIGIFYSAIGYAEDWATTKILGKATDRESIYFEQFLVYADIKDVKNRLLKPEIRDGLNLQGAYDGTEEEGYIFKTKSAFSFRNDIMINRDKQYPELTNIRVTYYEVAKYNLRVSKEFIEETHKMSWYTKDVFFNHTPTIAVEVLSPFANNRIDSAVDRVIDNMQGLYVASKQFSLRDKAKIALLVIVAVLTVAIFLLGEPTYGAMAIAIEVLIAIIGLPDIIRKRTG